MADEQNDVVLCNSIKLAEVFGLTARSVQNLARDGVIPRVAHGKFDFMLAARAYISHLKAKISGHITAPEEGDLKARLLKAQAEDAEAKAAQRRMALALQSGKIFKREEITRQWTARLIEFKAAMLELPGRAAFRFTDPDVRIAVEEEVNLYIGELLERYSRDGIMPQSAVGSGYDEAGSSTAEADIREPVE